MILGAVGLILYLNYIIIYIIRVFLREAGRTVDSKILLNRFNNLGSIRMSCIEFRGSLGLWWRQVGIQL